MSERVVIARAETYDQTAVAAGIAEVLSSLGGITRFVSPGEKVLIKPNMLEGLSPDKAVTTHPEVLRAVIRSVQETGAVPLVGDSPGSTGTLKAAERSGLLAVCREEDVELLPFDTTIELPYPAGLTVKKFTLARPLTEVDKVISLAKMKTHTFMGTTGAAKNMFGFIVGVQKAQFHLRMQARREFAAMLVDLANLVKPVLSIVDGVVGMEGNGPRNGKPVKAGVILAGTNCFAVDVVMAELMGFKPERLPLTALALQRGLTPPLAGIDLVGSARDIRFKFVEPHSMNSLEDRVPKWVAHLGRNQLTARPEINAACIGCGRCATHCPPQAMTIVDGKVRIDYDKCIRCYCCQELCPENAVFLEEGHVLKLVRRFL
ncbi:MAG: DUF362 domain-containing protein [Negativicutes bacterium]|nr:DUF362 domain-containing protein [Negativicutes bacterium]